MRIFSPLLHLTLATLLCSSFGLSVSVNADDALIGMQPFSGSSSGGTRNNLKPRTRLDAGVSRVGYLEGSDISVSEFVTRVGIDHTQFPAPFEFGGSAYTMFGPFGDVSGSSILYSGVDGRAGLLLNLGKGLSISLLGGYAYTTTKTTTPVRTRAGTTIATSTFGFIGMNGIEIAPVIRMTLWGSHHIELAAKYVPSASGLQQQTSVKQAEYIFSYCKSTTARGITVLASYQTFQIDLQGVLANSSVYTAALGYAF